MNAEPQTIARRAGALNPGGASPWKRRVAAARPCVCGCRLIRVVMAFGCIAGFARAATASLGANQPYVTYEAEAMSTSGTVLGPRYDPYEVETESSQQRCVKLSRSDDQLDFVASADGNAVVVRYSLPDMPTGGGTDATLELAVNGQTVRTLPLTSRYSHLYGNYPFSNDPAQGKERNFYDEVRVKDVLIRKGDRVELRRFAGASWCIVDLVDIEAVAPPRLAPNGALSLRDFGGKGDGQADDTDALRRCVTAAARGPRTVWVAAGEYKLTGDIVVPSGVVIQGAGMWHTTFLGDAALYGHADRRVRFKLTGTGAGLADFAIMGRLNYRNDQEPNDGVVGNDCTGASVERVWIEHTKTGVWVYNGAQMTIAGCRFRNLLADGVNLCVGTTESVVEDCSARGTGDDCFAIWPVPADQGFVQRTRPGRNVIRRCTGQLPFLANGGAIYGGADNKIEECRFTDITFGCGILISTTFPTTDERRGIDNNFSGTTVVSNCEVLRCGGFDDDWEWRAALQICLDRRSISGLTVLDVTVRDSLSDGISVVAPGSAKGEGTLSRATLERVTVEGVGLGTKGRGLWIRKDAHGGLTVNHCVLGSIVNDAEAFALTAR